MPRRGVPPEPRRLRMLKGETAPHEIAPWEPEAEAGPVEPPDFLSPDAVEVWERLSPELTRIGLLAPRYADQFAILCESIVQWRRAARAMAVAGPVIKGQRDGGLVSNPFSREFARYAELVRRYSIEFGMTPSAVTAIGRELSGLVRHSDGQSKDPGRIFSA